MALRPLLISAYRLLMMASPLQFVSASKRRAKSLPLNDWENAKLVVSINKDIMWEGAEIQGLM